MSVEQERGKTRFERPVFLVHYSVFVCVWSRCVRLSMLVPLAFNAASFRSHLVLESFRRKTPDEHIDKVFGRG